MSADKEKTRKRRKNDYRYIAKRTHDHQVRFRELGLLRKSGYLRKTNAFTCGVPMCPFCTNPRRVYGRVTLAEIKADRSFKEALAELL